jgi:hypothetical protein
MLTNVEQRATIIIDVDRRTMMSMSVQQYPMTFNDVGCDVTMLIGVAQC